MNSDPHDSAAWRTFGILDADETAGFDEAARLDPELKKAVRDIESIAATVAVVSTAPVMPRAGQLERLQMRLGIQTPKKTNWAAISGWAAAIALAGIFTISRTEKSQPPIADAPSVTPPAPTVETLTLPAEQPVVITPERAIPNQPNFQTIVEATVVAQQIVQETTDTRRLIQEIDVLRDQLEHYARRDQERFSPVQGMAWPIVMRMIPPDMQSDVIAAISSNEEETPLTTVLGDTMLNNGQLTDEIAARAVLDKEPEQSMGGATLPPMPMAVPIYDTARDTGTLIVHNLPSTAEGESINLWVETDKGKKAIYVGKLPKGNPATAAESFDFNLGSMGVVPSAFILTKDNVDLPTEPEASNVILQGPR